MEGGTVIGGNCDRGELGEGGTGGGGNESKGERGRGQHGGGKCRIGVGATWRRLLHSLWIKSK